MTTKPVTWSHSSLKDYEGCARRYHEVKVLKKYPFVETDATRYGTVLHKAAEDYVADGVPIPPEFEFVTATLDALIAKPGRKIAELQMALTQDLDVCDWKSEDAWARGIADLLIIDDENMTAWVVDYKTGNDKYPDRDQLRLMSLMVFKHFPHIRKVNSALLFVVKNDMVKHTMTVDETDAEWWRYRERVAKLESCYATGVWNPTRTPLCGWCPVRSCEFNPKH
jgi:RecB family exonuclease